MFFKNAPVFRLNRSEIRKHHENAFERKNTHIAVDFHFPASKILVIQKLGTEKFEIDLLL